MFSVGYESSKSQPHPLNTPIKHTYFVHLNYISCTIHLYRSDVQADYLRTFVSIVVDGQRPLFV